jgi:hypothetical protein
MIGHLLAQVAEQAPLGTVIRFKYRNQGFEASFNALQLRDGFIAENRVENFPPCVDKLVDDRQAEFLFTGEEIVKRTLWHLGLLQDRLDAGSVETPAQHDVEPDLNDIFFVVYSFHGFIIRLGGLMCQGYFFMVFNIFPRACPGAATAALTRRPNHARCAPAR